MSFILCRKPSSADLQSRLKSRKLLGVGATDDGMDIHRSKVSFSLSQLWMLVKRKALHRNLVLLVTSSYWVDYTQKMYKIKMHQI